VTDSDRTSASTGLPTPVCNGTPAGHPTPAGEPASPDQSELFPGLHAGEGDDVTDPALLVAIGGLVLAWGQLEQTTAEKLAVMRQSFGDVRAVGGRTRPTIQKLLAELRALVAMRDRHDKQVLTTIAEMDGVLQRTAQFRQIVLEGAYEASGEGLLCRDMKNSPIKVTPQELAREIAQINRIRNQIAAL
jgi:hypothetical protein